MGKACALFARNRHAVKGDIGQARRAVTQHVAADLTQVFEHVRALGVSDEQEHFFALYLDPKRRLLCSPKVVTTGLVNASMIHPRELFREAIQWGATSLYVAHNHPSGDATPSKDDIETTRVLLEASRIMEITLRDHIVIGTENTPGPAWVSIFDRLDVSGFVGGKDSVAMQSSAPKDAFPVH